MIGAGAIGCELLKNFAMVGLCSQGDGHLVLTDPDHIEVSNLNRQFLFREKHLRKPKSATAAAAVIQMNPDMQGHIEARLDKVHEDTSDIYCESFF
jgi:molybdopterin/thiamine biosynthesis adenylyltransferase